MVNAIRAFLAKLSGKPASTAIKPRKIGKHIRVTHWAHYCTIAYYGDNGRKLTKRKAKPGDIGRLINQARSNGYCAINF